MGEPLKKSLNQSYGLLKAFRVIFLEEPSESKLFVHKISIIQKEAVTLNRLLFLLTGYLFKNNFYPFLKMSIKTK